MADAAAQDEVIERDARVCILRVERQPEGYTAVVRRLERGGRPV